MNVLTHAAVYTGEEKIQEGFIRYAHSILNVGSMAEYTADAEDQIIDVSGKIIVPGFIDIHSHGGYGFDSMDGDPEEIGKMVYKMQKEGITSYFATTMTQSYENIEKALIAIKKAAQQNPVIQGIHLEGPFVSVLHKGAQPEKYIRIPDAEQMRKWNDLTDGMIRLVTYAPETSKTADFEAYCKEHDIVLSVGHSDALRAQLKASGASHITHLYNAQRGLHHREPGVVGHAFLEDDVTVEMIVDGFHITPDMVKLAYKIKGPERIELITDSMRAKGIPEGESELGGQKVIVNNKQARLEDGTLAGSVLEFQDAFKNMIEFTGCSISDAVKMSSVNQSREFGLSKKGTIEIGKDADMVVLNQDLTVSKTISRGESIE